MFTEGMWLLLFRGRNGTSRQPIHLETAHRTKSNSSGSFVGSQW